MGYSVLLIEKEALAAQSLYYSLLGCHQTVTLVHTLGDANVKIATQWPDLIILNFLARFLDLVEFEEAITKTDLDIPHLVLIEPPCPANISPEVCLHPPYTKEQLLQQMAEMIHYDRFLRVGDFILDTGRKKLLRTGRCYKLTPKLFALLNLLMKNQGQIVARKVIMKEIWQTDYMGDTRTLDVHIRWIREKIEDDPSRPKHLLTVRGMGYRFVAEPA